MIPALAGRVGRWAAAWPWSLALPLVLLGVSGVAAIARAAELSTNPAYFQRFADQQAFYLAAGVALAIIIGSTNSAWVQRWAYLLFCGVMVLLLMVYFFPPVNNAHRWLRMGGLSIQPSEPAKLVLVATVARIGAVSRGFRTWKSLAGAMTAVGVVVGLVLPQPDLGTALVFVPVLFIMLFAAGVRWRALSILFLLLSLALPVIWATMSPGQRARVSSLFEPVTPGRPVGPNNYQLYQARVMMAAGGFWGTAFSGEPLEDVVAYRLPEAHNDFVFCVVLERWGIVGAGVVLSLFGLLVWRALALVGQWPDAFGRLFVIGWAAITMTQTLINVGMIAGVLPITGLPLPMMSYGGSALLTQCCAWGIVISFARRAAAEIGPDPFRE